MVESAVRVILTNPRYTGHQVGNKQRKQELLIDVDDVALGHETRLTWNAKGEWIYSDQPVHEALITVDAFEQVQLRLASRGPRSTGREITRRNHPYAYRGLLFHDSCGRRMQGTWNHDKAHYRCRYPSEYALANQLDHPPSVYLREDQISGPLDAWLGQAFHPDHLKHTLAQLENAQPDHTPAIDAARRSLTEHDQKLARHRAALEAGADPALIAQWSRQVQQERELVAAQIAALEARTGADRRMSRQEIQALVESLGGLLAILRSADAADKLEIYRQLGLKLTYNHEKRTVLAEASPKPPVGLLVVSGGGLDRTFSYPDMSWGVHVLDVSSLGDGGQEHRTRRRHCPTPCSDSLSGT